jgi:hypothetical protein
MLTRILFLVLIGITSRGALSQSSSDACCKCGGGEPAKAPIQAVCLTAKEMRGQLEHFEPLQPSGFGHGLNLTGTVVLDIRFDAAGKVICSHARSGHPIAIAAAMRSVPKWSFRPVKSTAGAAKEGCGQITVKYHLRDQGSSSGIQ